MSFVTYFRDTLQNLITGLGQIGIDPSRSVQYVLNEIDRNTLENMFRGDWLSRKICVQPAEDMTREWRSWQANQSQIAALEEVEKTMDLRRKVKDWIIKARLYGGSALVIGVDDGNPPNAPIDLEKCKKGCLRYVVVLHRYELNAGPRIYNVNDPYYTRPAYYTVATPMFGFEGENMGTTMPTRYGEREQVPGAQARTTGNVLPFTGGNRQRSYPITTPTNIGLEQIHPSRVLELPGNELPDWRLAPLGGGWGDSVLQTVVDTVNSFTTTYQSISAMVSDGKMDVVKIPDMSLKLTNNDYKDKLIERFALSAQSKSVISALLLDKEEDWERIVTNYSGLPMIMHEFITLISGAAEIPVSILFGQAYGRGMQGGSTGSSGGGDEESYYNRQSSKQRTEVAPRLGMLDQVLMRSAIGREDKNIHYDWNPLWQMSDADKSKMNFQDAQTTQIYVSTGLINEDALREGVVNKLVEGNVYPGLDDAIEEYGSEPEEPDDTGGFGIPGGGPPGGNGGGGFGQAGGGRPNPEDLGHAGAMDKWTEEAREAAALAKKAHAKEIAHALKKAAEHDAKADEAEGEEDSRKTALHRMAAHSYRSAASAYRRGDVESAKLHSAVGHHMMHDTALGVRLFWILDEAAGHIFHGNQHTGSLGAQAELPLTGGADLREHQEATTRFLRSPGARKIISVVAREAMHIGEHVGKHHAEVGLISAIDGALMALGVPAAGALTAAAIAGYAVHEAAKHLNVSLDGAHKVLKTAVKRLRSFAQAMDPANFPSEHKPFFADALRPSVLHALMLLEHVLDTHTAAQLSKAATGQATDYDPNEPRDPKGKWTTGGGGGKQGDHPGQGYSKQAYLDEHGVIHTDNVDDAVLALYQEKKVELNQVNEVSTLLDKLGKIAQEARATSFTLGSGIEAVTKKVPVFDLCNVSVKGTNLFCAESHGIKRIQMPQFKDKAQQDAFTAYIRDKYKVTETQEYASHLRATQSELNGATVAYKMSQYRKNPAKADEPIIVSRDNYILDGHHGWAANIGIDAEDGKLDSGKKMNVLRVNIGTIQLLQEANKFTGKKGRKGIADRRRRARDYSPDQPRDPQGRWTVGAGIEAIAGGVGAAEELGAGTFGKTEPAGGEKASPGVPKALVKAIEDHIDGVGGEYGQHGSGDLTEWLMRTHKAEMLKLIDDMPPNKRPMLLLHKGDEAKGIPTVWLLGWSQSEKTDIHDHVRSEVGISALRGNTDNEWNIPGPGYLDAAKSEGGLHLPINKDVTREGQTITLGAPYIHLMRGTSPSKEPGQRDVTVHAYHPPLKQMHYFKMRGGALHYDGDWDEDRPASEYATRDSLVLGCPCCATARDD